MNNFDLPEESYKTLPIKLSLPLRRFDYAELPLRNQHFTRENGYGALQTFRAEQVGPGYSYGKKLENSNLKTWLIVLSSQISLTCFSRTETVNRCLFELLISRKLWRLKVIRKKLKDKAKIILFLLFWDLFQRVHFEQYWTIHYVHSKIKRKYKNAFYFLYQIF